MSFEQNPYPLLPAQFRKITFYLFYYFLPVNNEDVCLISTLGDGGGAATNRKFFRILFFGRVGLAPNTTSLYWQDHLMIS